MKKVESEYPVLFWKRRMMAKLKSIRGQLNLDFEGLLKWADHIDLDSIKIKRVMGDIEIKFNKLEEAIKNADTQK